MGKNRSLTILLTNDDGIYAPGLYALYREMKKLGETFVVAPDSERSAVGHAITITNPLRVWPFRRNGQFFGYAVNGTPADCVKLGCLALLDRKPDLVVSGINLGSNTGINLIYSGTASAATEATILGIPSFAISLTTYTNPDFTFAAKFARRLARLILKRGLPPETFLNVNVPPVKESEIRGVAITRQGKSLYQEKFDKRVDPRDKVYYWLTGIKINRENEGEDTDDWAVAHNLVSITPVHYDMTNYNVLDELKRWDFKI